MAAEHYRPWKHLLDPIARISEVLFGLIMVLTFTGSLSIAEANRQNIRTMLFAALGCNLAWGLIDAVMYLMVTVTERRHGMFALRAMQNATDSDEAHRIIRHSLPSLVASSFGPPELEAVRRLLQKVPSEPATLPLQADDWRAAFLVFLLVFLATFPVTIPFIVMQDAGLALRVSNGVAIAMLFLTGYLLGRYANHRPWLMGLVMVVVGVTLVGITIALGG